MGVGTGILTVGDDERIRAVRLALEDEGWTVMESGNGEDASSSSTANRPTSC
jgi:hypothetical protein